MVLEPTALTCSTVTLNQANTPDGWTIYRNWTPWDVVVTIAVGNRGSFGVAGAATDEWVVVRRTNADGEELAASGVGATVFSAVVPAGKRLIGLSDAEVLAFAVLGVVALTGEKRASAPSLKPSAKPAPGLPKSLRRRK